MAQSLASQVCREHRASGRASQAKSGEQASERWDLHVQWQVSQPKVSSSLRVGVASAMADMTKGRLMCNLRCPLFLESKESKSVNKMCKEAGIVVEFNESDLSFRLAQHLSDAHGMEWSEAELVASDTAAEAVKWTEAARDRSRSPPHRATSGGASSTLPSGMMELKEEARGNSNELKEAIGSRVMRSQRNRASSSMTQEALARMDNFQLLMTFQNAEKEMLKRGMT